MTARFRISGRLDTGRLQEGTVSIDRNTMVLTVRPLRRRRGYSLPLGTVAEIIVSKCIKAEVAAKRAAKKLRRGIS